MKSTLNLTQIAFNNFIDFTKSCMPNDENLVSNFYDAKTFIRPLGLGYEKYDVCPNYCMLYYGADAMKINCDFCGSSQYNLEIRLVKVPIRRRSNSDTFP
jgi:hypothetical protein